MQYVLDAYSHGWKREDYDAVGLAMEAWRGEGQHDNLRADRLKKHRDWARRKDVQKQGKLAARIRGELVAIATFVKRHGVEIRKLLKLDSTSDEPTAAVDEIRKLHADLKAEREKTDALTVEKRRADDSRRQAKHRLAKKVGGVKEARRDEKAKATY